MTAFTLLSELHGLGVTLTADGDRLRFHPKESVTSDLLQRIRDHKPELITLLAKPFTPRQPDFSGWRSYVTEDGTRVFESPNAPPRRRWREPLLNLSEPNFQHAGNLDSATSSKWRCVACPSTEFVDVPIHKGQSVRRDCRQCGRFDSFPVWYGKQESQICDSTHEALPNGGPTFVETHKCGSTIDVEAPF